MTNGENHMLISGGSLNYGMRHYGRQTFRRKRKTYKSSIQHVPSSIGNSILTNDQLITFQAVATVTAGSSLTSNRMETDRLTEVGNGFIIGNMTVTVAMFPGSSNGYLEYIVFKAERQGSTPVKGTFPIPSDAEVLSSGMQQVYRSNMPGWIIKYGTIPYTPETIHTRDIKFSFTKFGKGKVRDGDFYGVAFFNRGASTITFDWQCRYKSYI